DAFILQAVANVDARGADLHAQGAIDAVAQAVLFLRGLAGARTPWLAARHIVGDRERVVIEHHALKARIRAHVLAHLLAQPARVAVGGQAVEEDPETLPRTQTGGEDLVAQRANGREVAHEGKARPERHHQPDAML